jgi:hypothetical protein
MLVALVVMGMLLFVRGSRFWRQVQQPVCAATRESSNPRTNETMAQPACAWRRERVADPAHGLDSVRILRIVLDLPPQTRAADVDAAIEGIPVPVARQRHQLIAPQRSVRSFSENPQQVELGAGQRNLVAMAIE